MVALEWKYQDIDAEKRGSRCLTTCHYLQA